MKSICVGAVEKIITCCKNKYEKQVALLDSLSPLKTMLRGYSVTCDSNGNLISKVNQIKTGDNITVKLTDGNINAKVESVGG